MDNVSSLTTVIEPEIINLLLRLCSFHNFTKYNTYVTPRFVTLVHYKQCEKYRLHAKVILM